MDDSQYLAHINFATGEIAVIKSTDLVISSDDLLLGVGHYGSSPEERKQNWDALVAGSLNDREKFLQDIQFRGRAPISLANVIAGTNGQEQLGNIPRADANKPQTEARGAEQQNPSSKAEQNSANRAGQTGPEQEKGAPDPNAAPLPLGNTADSYSSISALDPSNVKGLTIEELQEMKDIREEQRGSVLDRIGRTIKGSSDPDDKQAVFDTFSWAPGAGLLVGSIPIVFNLSHDFMHGDSDDENLVQAAGLTASALASKYGGQLLAKGAKYVKTQLEIKILTSESRKRIVSILENPKDFRYGVGKWWESHIQSYALMRESMAKGGMHQHHIILKSFLKYGPAITKGLQDFVPTISLESREHLGNLHRELNAYLTKKMKKEIKHLQKLSDLRKLPELNAKQVEAAFQHTKQFYKDMGLSHYVAAIDEFINNAYNPVKK